MALRPLPTIGPASPTGNVSMQGATSAQYEAAARLGQSVANAADAIRAQVEADQRAQDERALSEASIARNDTLNALSLEFREGDAFRTAADAAAEDAINAAPARIRRDVELMWRQGISTQEGIVRNRAYQDHVRDMDSAMSLSWESENAYIEDRARDLGSAVWDDPDVQRIIQNRERQATERAYDPDLNYGGDEYVETQREQLLTRIGLSVIAKETLDEYERTGSIDAARNLAEEGLGNLTLSNAVYDSAMSSIMSDVRGRDTDRRRAAEAVLRAHEGSINNALAESRRGNGPDLSMINLLGGSEQGRDLLAQMNTNVAQHQLTQRYIGESAEGRAAMYAEADSLSGVARDQYEAAISAGQQYVNSYRNDPVGFVMGTNEDLTAQMEFALGPDGSPQDVQAATQGLIDAQLRAGYLPRDVRVLRDSDAQRMVDSMQLDLSDPNARATLVSMVQNIDLTYGAYSGRVFQELEDAGLNPAALHIANTRWMDEDGNIRLTQAASLAEHAATSSVRDREGLIDANDNNRGRDNSVRNNIEDEVNRALAPIFATVVPYIPSAAADRQRIYDQTYDLALQAVIEGRSPRQAAGMAITAYTDRYQFEGTVRIPNSVNRGDVLYRIDDFMDNLSTDTITIGPAPDGQPQEFTDFENRTYVRMVREHGTWATRPDDSGVMLFDHTGRPVIDAQTGEQVSILWGDTALTPAERQAGDAQLRALGMVGP